MSCSVCNQLTCCGCGSQSTQEVCGNFETPINPDLGQCSPYRTKRTCEAPVRPSGDCPGDDVEVEYRPSNTNAPFKLLTFLFDENCEKILDQNGAPIQTYIN